MCCLSSILTPFRSDGHSLLLETLSILSFHKTALSWFFSYFPCHFSIFWTHFLLSYQQMLFSEFGLMFFSQIPQISLPGHSYLNMTLVIIHMQTAHTFISSPISPLSFVLGMYHLSWKAGSTCKPVCPQLKSVSPWQSAHAHFITHPLLLSSESVNGTIVHPIRKARNLCRNQIRCLLPLYLPYSTHLCVLLVFLPK